MGLCFGVPYKFLREIAVLEVFLESQWFFWVAIAVASDLRFEVAAIRVTKLLHEKKGPENHSKHEVKLRRPPLCRPREALHELEESIESPKSLNSLESLENGRILLVSKVWGSLDLRTLESLENGLFWKDPFPKEAYRVLEFWGDAPEQFKSRYV